MDKHLIESQFDSFFEKLKRKKKIKYEFEIDSTWYEYHGKMEMLNDDVIEGVSERFIDGDDGASKIIIQWMYDELLPFTDVSDGVKDFHFLRTSSKYGTDE